MRNIVFSWGGSPNSKPAPLSGLCAFRGGHAHKPASAGRASREAAGTAVAPAEGGHLASSGAPSEPERRRLGVPGFEVEAVPGLTAWVTGLCGVWEDQMSGEQQPWTLVGQ